MVDMKYKPVSHNHKTFLKKALKRRGFRRAYESSEEECKLAREMLRARSKFGLTQESVAKLMGTTKSAVSRLEAVGKNTPSATTLRKYARAVSCRLEIKVAPAPYSISRSTRSAKKPPAR